MKKIFAFIVIAAASVTFSYAQTAVSTGSTTVSTEQSTPVVKVADVNNNQVKCASEASKSACCSHGSNKTAAVTTSSTEGVVTTSDVKTEGDQCKSVSFGTSAAKPESAKVDNTPEN